VTENARMTRTCRCTCYGAAASLLALGIVGCSSERRPSQGVATPAASQPAALVPARAGTKPVTGASATARKTTLRGVARDAKGGAVVVTDRGPVYILGLDAWPTALAGSTVEVMGVVRQRKHLPDPVGPGNTVAQGAWGEQTVVEGATWRVAE
jgi:hypothetical protein